MNSSLSTRGVHAGTKYKAPPSIQGQYEPHNSIPDDYVYPLCVLYYLIMHLSYIVLYYIVLH